MIMDEEKIVEEQDTKSMNDDELKKAIEGQLSKIRRQSILIGAQTACKVVLDKINTFERSPGNKSNNDHKRLIKDIKKFCEIGVSRKVNADGETEPIQKESIESETVQN